MATLKLTIYRQNNKNAKKNLENDIVLETSIRTAKYKFNGNDYLLSLAGLDINMQMYRPSEILADISIAMDRGNNWITIPRTCFEIFKDKKVGLSSGEFLIGKDFYVHEVIPECYSDSIHLKLKIYSPDKVLTLKNTSRTFVGKRLSEILTSELKKYSHPADEKDCLKFNTDNLQVLKFERLIKNKVQDEHMFPFLVQYNESIYDLLARTANRWGEFMYYRDGKLHFGYNEKQAPNDLKDQDKKNKYYKITYPSYNTDAVLTNGDGSGVYDLEAVYDATVSDTPVEESPYKVKGELGKFNGAADKYFMRKIASFLGNDKDLITWLFNNLVDDSVSVAESVVYNKMLNKDLDGEYFTDENKTKYPLQFGEQEFTLYEDVKEKKQAYNQFTEYNSIYTSGKYKKILEAERASSKNLVQINFNTTYPDVKLGDQIIVDKEKFIVVGITGKTTEQYIEDDGEITTHYSFVVTAIARKDDKSIFYPTMLPSGHVRYSGPQKGAIMAANDPTLNHRVRVLFDWQYEGEETVEDEDTGQEIKMPKPIDDATEASPWLIFAAKGEGKPSTGRHVVASKVLVGFVDGNIERPYVMGYIQDKTTLDKTIDVDLDTDQGHYLRLSDGSRGAGLSSFLFGAFSPAASTISDFWPNFAFNLGKSAHLEGGFKLSDYYGIYKITGSSDQRNVTISSPWGDVKMNAFTGITISAPNGDVKISGKNVTIEAGNNLKLVSGTNAGYKIFRDKKYKNAGAGMAMTAAAAVANRLAQKLKLIDITFVRSVVEVVMRPVEGALTVKSNRYLKLEAGKNACEYPASAFNVKKRQEIIDKAAAKQFNGKAPLSKGFCRLFKITGIVPENLSNFNVRYNRCVRAKQRFEDSILELRKWSNDRSQSPCKGYSDLKEKLWKKDAKIAEGDLAFVEDLVGDDNIGVLALINVPEGMPRDKKNALIKLKRKTSRDLVVYYANLLKSQIEKLLDYDIQTKWVKSALGKDKHVFPKDAADKLCEALSKAKNENLFIYKIPDDMKNLANERPSNFSNAECKQMKRAFWLNLMEAYGMINSRKGVNLPPKPQGNNVMDDNVWKAFVDSLDGVLKPEYEIVKTDGDKFKEALSDAGKSLIDYPKIRGMIDEVASFSDGQDGCILIGANDETYQLSDGNNANPQLRQIEKLIPKVTEEGAKEFIEDLKKILKK